MITEKTHSVLTGREHRLESGLDFLHLYYCRPGSLCPKLPWLDVLLELEFCKNASFPRASQHSCQFLHVHMASGSTMTQQRAQNPGFLLQNTCGLAQNWGWHIAIDICAPAPGWQLARYQLIPPESPLFIILAVLRHLGTYSDPAQYSPGTVPPT